MKINLISIIFMVIFAVCSVVDLYCLIKEDKKKNKIFKPMLMPLLAVCYVLTANHVKPLVIAALATLTARRTVMRALVEMP